MHTSILRFLLPVLFLCPAVSHAQCHHWGGHGGRSGFHGGGGHFHYHGGHSYHPHYHCRQGRGYGRYSSDRHMYGRESAVQVPLAGRHEIAAGTGVASAWQVTDNTINSAGMASGVSYRYYLSKGVAVGVSVSAQSLGGNDSCHCSTAAGNPESAYHFSLNTVTVAGTLNYMMYSRRLWQVYGSVALGACIFHEHDVYEPGSTGDADGVRMTGHFSPLGLRYGRALGAYAELGFGYKGLVNGGISWQVQKPHHKVG